MKIRFLVLAIDNLAGTERAALAQASALAARHDVEIVSVLRTSSDAPVRSEPGVRVRYLASTGGNVGADDADLHIDHAAQLAELPPTLVPAVWDPTMSALSDVALERYLPTADADVVVTMTPGLLAAAVQRLPARTAVVHQEHRSSMHRTAGMEALLAFAPRADAVVSLTEANATWLRQQLGVQAPAIHVVPNAAPGPEQPRSLLDQPVIMAAGRLDGGKQYVHLVRAFGSIAAELPEWRLRIFGSGKKRASLMRAARRQGLYDRLELPGATNDLPTEWAKASISALTSKLEGLPLVIQESFAAGVPVVAYDCGTGPAELIEHGVNGYLVRQDDEEALAGHLLELARDHELRSRLGAAARGSLERFDIEAITQRWEKIYSDAAREHSTGAAPWTGRLMERQNEKDQARGARVSAPAITPGESRRRLFGATTGALADIPGWFALAARGEEPPTVVVPQEHRGATLDVLQKAEFPDHVSLYVAEDDHWLSRRGPVGEIARALHTALVTGFTLEPWPDEGDIASPLAFGAGIRVEFWSRDRSGALVAPIRNGFARRVDPTDVTSDIEIEGASVPGLTELAGPLIDDCRFPVDVVYTWVDGDDPQWRAARDRRFAGTTSDQARREASGEARFRERDELRYSLRSVHAHAPWVRTIYVLTAGQRPAWLLEHPKVKVVDHSEILPADALPTFNSHAIETALHKIPGLAEHFIYFNDDMFLARPVGPGRFFSPAGDVAVFYSDGTVGLTGRDGRPFIAAAVNNRRLLRERFGVTTTHTLNHIPYPLRRSLLDEVCREFAAEIGSTARSPFRSPGDVSLTSSLVQHYGLVTGAAFVGDLNLDFVDTTRANLRSRLREVLQREKDVFCLGDHHDYALPEDKVGEALSSFYAQYFPVRPPWEAG